MKRQHSPLPALNQPVGPFFVVEEMFTPGPGAWSRYAAELAALRGVNVSGVYCIMDEQRRALYVGESHTGRLYDTITRHFRQWKIDPSNDAQGRRRGGTTYDRSKVLIAYTLTLPGDAAALQYAEILRLRPRDNAIECSSEACADAHDIPF